MKPGRVITFGESLLTLRAAAPVRLGPNFSSGVAGAESNVAIGLSRLGHDTTWVGVIGADEPGEFIQRTLRAENVTVHARVDTARPTGLMLVEKILGHSSRVTYHRKHSAGSTLRPGDVMEAFDGNVAVVHVTGITPALSPQSAETTRVVLEEARHRGIAVSFDINYRNKLWSRDDARQTLTPLARLATVVVGSEDEFDLIGSGDATAIAENLIAEGATHVGIKRGSAGAGLVTPHGTLSAPAHSVPVVDTIGAGDAFVAGLLSGFLDGCGDQDSLARAVACGAFAVTAVGDWEGAPTRDDLGLLAITPGETLR